MDESRFNESVEAIRQHSSAEAVDQTRKLREPSGASMSVPRMSPVQRFRRNAKTGPKSNVHFYDQFVVPS